MPDTAPDLPDLSGVSAPAAALHAWRAAREHTQHLDTTDTVATGHAALHGRDTAAPRADLDADLDAELLAAYRHEADAGRALIASLDAGHPLPRRWESAAAALTTTAAADADPATVPDHAVPDGELRSPQGDRSGLLTATTSDGDVVVTVDPQMWGQTPTGAVAVTFNLARAQRGPTAVYLPGRATAVASIDASDAGQVRLHLDPTDPGFLQHRPDVTAGPDPCDSEPDDTEPTAYRAMWEVLWRLGSAFLLPTTAL